MVLFGILCRPQSVPFQPSAIPREIKQTERIYLLEAVRTFKCARVLIYGCVRVCHLCICKIKVHGPEHGMFYKIISYQLQTADCFSRR
jgi:hypothetical protein